MNLNIAHFASPYLPSTQTFIYNYLQNFQHCSSHVFAFDFENLDQFAVANQNRISKCSFSWLTWKAAQIFRISGKTYNNRIFDLNNTGALRHRLGDLGISLIHSHFGHMGCYNVNLKRTMRLPMVTTFYGWDLSFLARTGWADRYTTLFAQGDCFFVEGSHMKSSLAALGCPENKIEIIHIGADLREFHYRERNLQHDEKIILLFCGRFIEKKGLEYALRALALLRDWHARIVFRVIGDGYLTNQIVGLIKELKLEATVQLLGALPYAETRREMEKAHIMVQPSVIASNGETEGGAPTVLIEAQACGMPIIASMHADIPEVVLNGVSGLLSEERNYKKLAEHMFYMLNHSDSWPQMGAAGRKHVEINYNIVKEAEKIEKVYKRLID